MHVHAMRKLFFVIAVLAIVGVAPAFAQAANITITKTGFAPASVTIAPGESITWTNSDTVDHQVNSTKASLASPVLHAGQTFSFKFATAGNFAFSISSSIRLSESSKALSAVCFPRRFNPPKSLVVSNAR